MWSLVYTIFQNAGARRSREMVGAKSNWCGSRTGAIAYYQRYGPMVSVLSRTIAQLRTDNVCTLVSKIACTNMSPKNNKKRNYNHNGGDVSPNKPMRMWV